MGGKGGIRRNKVNNNSCQICGKKPQVGYNRPHSLHRTKRLINPNIQKNKGKKICTRCLRTLDKKSKKILSGC